MNQSFIAAYLLVRSGYNNTDDDNTQTQVFLNHKVTNHGQNIPGHKVPNLGNIGHKDPGHKFPSCDFGDFLCRDSRDVRGLYGRRLYVLCCQIRDFMSGDFMSGDFLTVYLK